MGNDKKSIFCKPGKKNKGSTSGKGDSNLTHETKDKDRWHKELLSRLLQKSTSVEKARLQITKLIETKNALVRTVEEKNGEIYRLKDNILLLTQELSALRVDHLKALEELKIPKSKEYARKDETVRQKTMFYDEKKEPGESEPVFVQENLTTKKLESLKLNPRKWRIMHYADPKYFEMLQENNQLQKQLQKKMKSKKMQLKKNLLDMLKRGPYNLTKGPIEQMMECYRVIQLPQVNISDKYHKLANTV